MLMDCRRIMATSDLDIAIAAGDRAAAVEWLLRLVDPEMSVRDRALFAEIVAESYRNARIAKIFDAVRGEMRRGVLLALEELGSGGDRAYEYRMVAYTILSIAVGARRMTDRGHPDHLSVTMRLRAIVNSQIETIR